ncbi:MAG: 16S rRNA (uracil(1498)-N(3))-methyltransferase [Bacteroidia bacterium]
MHLFYTPEISGSSYTLPEEESKHAIRVLRLGVGDKVVLIDGKGGWFDAEITDENLKRCTVRILDSKRDYGKKNWSLHVAVAPTKMMERLEWFVEKATETGIDAISLIGCKNSERDVVKTERVVKVAVSAMKQSLKTSLPAISEMTAFEKFIEYSCSFSGEKFIAHCNYRGSLPHIKTAYTPGNNAMVLIGPEGDFTLEEVKLALDNGFKEISLGESRLRTETAALYACICLNVLNE